MGGGALRLPDVKPTPHHQAPGQGAVILQHGRLPTRG